MQKVYCLFLFFPSHRSAYVAYHKPVLLYGNKLNEIFVSRSQKRQDKQAQIVSVKWDGPTSQRASMNRLSSQFDTEAKLCNYSRRWHAHTFPIGLHCFHRNEPGISSDAVSKWSPNRFMLVVWMGSMLRTRGWDGVTRTLQGADPAAPSSTAVRLSPPPPPGAVVGESRLHIQTTCLTQKPSDSFQSWQPVCFLALNDRSALTHYIYWRLTQPHPTSSSLLPRWTTGCY